MTINTDTHLTQVISDLIVESEMEDCNTCPCCLPLIEIRLSQSTLEELVELLRPELLPLLRRRYEQVTKEF